MKRSRLEILTGSLDLVTDRIGDPAPLVYERLFKETPEMQELFWRDTAGLVRGQMLTVLFESLMDLADEKTYAPSLLQSERVNHENLGVPPEVFDSFLVTVLNTFREQLRPYWTEEMDSVWLELIAEATPKA